MVDMKSIKLDTVASSEMCGSIIKIIIHVLVEEDLVHIKLDNKDEFLVNLDKLVDACVDLMKLTGQIKPNKCFPFFMC